MEKWADEEIPRIIIPDGGGWGTGSSTAWLVPEYPGAYFTLLPGEILDFALLLVYQLR